MANKMSLGFVNDTHRGMRDSLVSVRHAVRPRPSPNPHPQSPEATAGVGVVPVIEPRRGAAPAQPPHAATREEHHLVREPRDSNTYERRLEFVAGQVKEIYETLGSLQGELRALENSTAQSAQQLAETSARAAKLSASLLTVRGECIAEAPQFADVAGSIGDSTSPIAAGTALVLAYPMVREQNGVLMRRMNVNPHTAAVSWTWAMLYQNHPDGEKAFVGKFTC